MIVTETQAFIHIIDQGSGIAEPILSAFNSNQINDITGYGLRYVLRVLTLHKASCNATLRTNQLSETCGTCFSLCFELH
jgi:hypothetical protein